MKNLKTIEPIYIEEFDIKVNPYLTTAQIQQIANGITTSDNWGERETNKNMLVLYHATDIGQEELEKHGYEELELSGLIDTVLAHVINRNKIDEAVAYIESTHRALSQILVKAGPVMEAFKQRVNKNGAASKK